MRKHIKALLVVLGICLMFCLCAFSWEGELDPNEFDKWEVLSVQPTPQGLVWIFARNPDQASPIDIVAMAVDLNSALFGYRYFKYGQIYSYVFNTGEDKYVRQYFTDEQKKSCMKCHSDKLIPEASI